MNGRRNLILSGLIMLWCLVSMTPATAGTLVVKDFQDLQVIGHHYTTSITTGSKRLSIKNPSDARYIVLKLAGTLRKGGGKVFTNDFTLAYVHTDSKEDRNECDAIATAKTANIGEFNQFYSGNGAFTTLDNGKNFFGLVFMVEKDVDKIDLYRLGITEPYSYRIGTERSYSVAIFTNVNAAILSQAEEVINTGGYQIVTASETLASGITGTSILYMDEAESQAREISQRLMTKLNVIPTVKKMDVISTNDIVVWLGK